VDGFVSNNGYASVSYVDSLHALISVTATSTTITTDLQSIQNAVVQIDMTAASTASTVTLTASNPVMVGTYTFHFQNVDAGGHDVDLPANFLNPAGTAWDGSTTVNYAEDDWLTCYFDGTNYHCK